jgi:hypothetical protein
MKLGRAPTNPCGNRSNRPEKPVLNISQIIAVLRKPDMVILSDRRGAGVIAGQRIVLLDTLEAAVND